jgi:arsenate reductase
MKIYYNPRCLKCRETLKLIESKGKTAEIVDYLNHPPTLETLQNIIKVLGIKPEELLRKKEPVFIERYKGKKLSDKEFLEAMVQNPQLIERPIVIDGNKAIIGRPPERVLDLL